LIIFAFGILQLPAQSDSKQPIIEACCISDDDPMPGGGSERPVVRRTMTGGADATLPIHSQSAVDHCAARYGIKVKIGPENLSVHQHTIECDKRGYGQTTLVKTQAGRISA
jgi:hypothetical protein